MTTTTETASPPDRASHTMHIVQVPKGWTVLRNDGRPMLLDPADHQPAYLEQRSEVEAQCHALGLVEVAEGNPAGWPAGTLVRLSIGGQQTGATPPSVVGGAQGQGTGSATARHDNGSPTVTNYVIQKISWPEDKAREAAAIRVACTNPGEMPQFVFLRLQELAESLERAAAQGQDCVEGFAEAQTEVNRLLDAAPWTLHPDYGCVTVEEAARRDREPSPSPCYARE